MSARSSLDGDAEGGYMGITRDLTATKRRIKRMLRCRDLKIVFVPCVYDFVKGWSEWA